MNESLFDQIQNDAKYLNLDFSAQEVAQLAMENDLSDENIQAVSVILDRIFDIATVFMIKGNSYRGKRCETIALSAGDPITIAKTKS